MTKTAKTPALRLFQELTSVPTAPFYEDGPARAALAWVRRHLRGRVRVRRSLGGIQIEYRGAGAGPALALAAHMDHPAFHVSAEDRREARAELKGGLPKELLPGARIEAFAARARSNRPLATGVVRAAGGGFRVRWDDAPSGRPVFATLALTPFEVRGAWLRSRSIDDLLGCAVSLETLRRVAAARVRTNLTVLLHRAEEVGFIGALELIRQGRVPPEDSILSIETSRAMPGARPGRGPVIRTGDRACWFDPNLLELLDEAGRRLARRGGRVQRTRLTGGTCEATAYLAFGYEAAGVAIPLVNYHNGGAGRVEPEAVRIEDVSAAVELLVEAARLFPQRSLRGLTKDRLSRRLRSERRLL